MTQNIIETPQVSVIIPLYNKRDWIGRALNSVLSQTIQTFEVVVVDDGSTDGGEEVVKSYTDPRIRLVRQKNQGVSAARNHGVAISQTELVTFLDADDEWLPEFLETILRLWEHYPEAGFYGTNISYTYNNSDEIRIPIVFGLKPNFEGIIPSVLRCAAMDGIFPNSASTTAVSKKVFLEFGGFRNEIQMGEDQDLWARIAIFYPCAYSNKPLAYYHHDDEHAATKNKDLTLLTDHPFYKSLQEYAETGVLEPENYSYDLALYVNSLNLALASANISCGKKREAKEYLKQITFKELKQRQLILKINPYTPNWIRGLLRKLYRCYNRWRRT